MPSRSFLLSGLAAGTIAVVAACAGDTTPTAPTAAAELAEGRMPGDPGDASERLFYQVKLEPEGESRARGMLMIDVAGGELRVRVHANGVEPGAHIPQHIHLNSGCNPGGGILINLDANLTIPGEGPGVGAAYPVASDAGVVSYEATRSLADLRGAYATFAGLNFATDAELLAHLDLENRNGHMHVAFGPPFPAVNCGEVERIN